MASAFNDLEKILLNEKKNYENRVVIGGIEPLVANWVTRVKTNGNDKGKASSTMQHEQEVSICS